MKTLKKSTIFLALISVGMSAQDTIMPLWPKSIPNQHQSNEEEVISKSDDGILWVTNVQKPTLEVYLPSKRNMTGQAVVIFPGGGYYGLAYD